MAITYVGSTSNSGNNPLTGDFTLPGGWAVNDVAIALWFKIEPAVFTAPLGLTQRHDVSTAGRGQVYAAHRVLQSGDTTFAWAATTVTNATTLWGAVVYRGVDTVTPFDLTEAAPAAYANTATPNPPAVTTVTNGAFVIAIAGDNKEAATAAITPPTNYTIAIDIASTAGDDGSLGVAHREITTAGLEDPGTFSATGWAAADDGYVWTFALRPASAVSDAQEWMNRSSIPQRRIVRHVSY